MAAPITAESNAVTGSGTSSPDTSTGMSSYCAEEDREQPNTVGIMLRPPPSPQTLSKLMPVQDTPLNSRRSRKASSCRLPWKPSEFFLGSNLANAPLHSPHGRLRSDRPPPPWGFLSKTRRPGRRNAHPCKPARCTLTSLHDLAFHRHACQIRSKTRQICHESRRKIFHRSSRENRRKIVRRGSRESRRGSRESRRGPRESLQKTFRRQTYRLQCQRSRESWQQRIWRRHGLCRSLVAGIGVFRLCRQAQKRVHRRYLRPSFLRFAPTDGNGTAWAISYSSACAFSTSLVRDMEQTKLILLCARARTVPTAS
jgi:hypothetical protein